MAEKVLKGESQELTKKNPKELTEKEMKKLSRIDLLKILVKQSHENDDLKLLNVELSNENKKLNNEIKENRVRLEKENILLEKITGTTKMEEVFKLAAYYIHKLNEEYKKQKEIRAQLKRKKDNLDKFLRFMQDYSKEYPELLTVIKKFDELNKKES